MYIRRRSFLNGVGAGTAAFLGGAFERSAFGQGAVPKRLLVLYMPNSSVRKSWIPQGGRVVGGAGGDATQYTLGACNATLAPAKSLGMTIVTGLDSMNVAGDAHASSIMRVMSGGTIRAGEGTADPGGGNIPDNGGWPALPSLDQVLLGKATALQGTPVDSLQIAADTRADNGRTDVHLRTASWALDQSNQTKPLAPQNQPNMTFSQLFSNVAMNGGDPAKVKAALEQQQSVLDFLKGDVGRLSKRLPVDQRPKLDSHLAAIQEMERQLMQQPMTGPTVTIPPAPTAVASNTSENHETVLNQYFSMIKLAFQLDVTRVVTYMFGSGNNQVVLNTSPAMTKGIHPTAHDYSDPQLIQCTSWYCDHVVKFLQDLDSAKESDGTSVLDNTIVFMFSEVGQYHEHNDIPIVLFGGSKLGLPRQGRVLKYTGRTPSDIWTGIAAALGVKGMTVAGDAKYNQGPLPELFTT